MKTWTGSEAPLGPELGEVNLFDLVVHAGRERRWGGFGSQEWTVLHHTALVTLIWMKAGYPVEGLPYVFIHDLHESYTGDVPSPVKRHLTGAKALEQMLDGRIQRELLLGPPSDEIRKKVKICDYAALMLEAPLFGPPGAAEGETATAMRVGDPNPEVLALRTEVDALVAKVMPNFDEVVRRRATVGSR